MLARRARHTVKLPPERADTTRDARETAGFSGPRHAPSCPRHPDSLRLATCTDSVQRVRGGGPDRVAPSDGQRWSAGGGRRPHLRMTTRKLLIGLIAAALCLAGFGGLAALPASASVRYVVTLASGETIEVDVPEGQTVEQVVGGPVLSATPKAAPTQATQPAAQAPAPLPAAPTQPATASEPARKQPKAPASSPETPTEEPEAAAEEQQETTGATKAKPRSKPEGSSKDHAKDEKDAKDDKAKRDADGTSTDARAQAPSPADSGFSLALPGPAPIGVPNFFIDKFRIPPFLLPIYQAAGIEYGVRWEVLAAINEIETDYGRNLNVSSAGAVGWMQFMPVELEDVRSRRQPRRPQGPVQPGRRDLRRRALPQGRRRRATTCATRSSPTTTPTGTSTASSCARG